MNIQEYISSGIVELCVLGLASPEERLEFERMCDAHEEVRFARNSFEQQLEKTALEKSVDPPRHLRSKIFSEIEIEKQKSGYPANGFVAESNNGGAEPARVIGISRSFRYAAAAAVILLVGSVAMNFYFYQKYKTVNDQYSALVQQQSDMAVKMKEYQARYDEWMAAEKKMNDPAMAVIRMEGKEVPASPDPSSMATVYWDTRTKDVYLRVNHMPSPASSEMQYQLWAIVDGVPVDAGVFDIREGVPYITMKNIPKAQAFAITLEKKGGRPVPEGKMYVLGKV